MLPMLCAALLFSEAGGDVGTCCLPAVSPEGKGREKVGSGEGKLKMLVVIDNNPFLPRLPLLVVCISMQCISWVTDLKQSTVENVTRLWHLSIAMHMGKIILLFS